ncbi:uncharacterized protein LOC100889187 isoform X2 [Strongylocentrotus purpuratus]|uniref:Uncharacterized protein n=1 Tax=Strongylocentrotus purpuratus TaxID=7668 RepID=A0A7M7HJQ7_STRPU|nr:uncharacterized protein LOC100889187 isoform X2 [Strongylocentrotus purpuratus]|eukprot:XP_011664933.1 PREDICTED: uncharacterized protein LOC100889187 isoform X2 [Strongylocentrotus purpuratus]
MEGKKRGPKPASPATRKARAVASQAKYLRNRVPPAGGPGWRAFKVRIETFNKWRTAQHEMKLTHTDFANHLLQLHESRSSTPDHHRQKKRQGVPLLASTPSHRGARVPLHSDSSSDVASLASTIHPDKSEENAPGTVSSVQQATVSIPQVMAEDLDLSVSFMEKGDFVFPHEKEEEDAIDDDFDPEFRLQRREQFTRDLLIVGEEEEEVLGDETDGQDEPEDFTRSGLHKKIGVEEAAEADLFIITGKRLKALAQEANPVCQQCQAAVYLTLRPANGTAAHITWVCPEGHQRGFCSQEMSGRSHVGDMMMSSAILLSGNNFDKIQKLATFARLNFLSKTTFQQQQANYIIPAIESHWERVQKETREKHHASPVVVCGDARNDSPGHCAQYCTYTFMEHTTNDVLHVGFVDKRQTASKSPNMELKGFKDGLEAMTENGLTVKEVVTDAHPSIAKNMRETRPDIVHSWDVWHGSKNLSKKLAKASTKAARRPLVYWVKHIIRHFWYCSKTCGGSVTKFKAMWHGLTHHVTNTHSWKAGLGGSTECEHGELDEREEWLGRGSEAHKALVQVCYDKRFINNFHHYINFRHTSMLESLHNHILMYASKRFSFQYPAYRARNLLAVIDFMAHKDRPDQLDKEGNPKYVAVWSKHGGDYVARKRKVPKTYTYVGDIMRDIFARRTADDQPMFRQALLRLDDPRRFQPRLAPFPPPPVADILARRAGRMELTESEAESEVD